MANLETLKQKRTVIRGLTTRTINKCEQFISEHSYDLTSLTEGLEQISAKNESLKDLDERIQVLIDNPSELVTEIETCEEYYEKIISIKTKIKICLKTLDKITNSSTNSDIREDSVSNDNSIILQPLPNNPVRGIKLPKLSINKFNGDSSSWLSFWSQYENAVHSNNNLTAIDKFNYLLSLVSGAAAHAISGFTLTNDNYLEAIELLKQRFGRNDLVINAHISKLLNLEPVKNPNNTNALRKLYDNIEVQIRNLKGLDVTSGAYGTLLTPILLKLLPNEMNLEFNRKKKTKENFDVNELLEFLRDEIECRETVNQIQDKLEINSSAQNNREKRIFKNPIPSAATLATGSEHVETHRSKPIERKLACFFCSKPHNSSDCQFALNLRLEQRRQILLKKGVCFRCLKQNHIASQCQSKIKCSNCNRFHHILLCPNINNNSIPQTFDNNKRNELSDTQDQTLANVTTTPHVLLQTIYVTVRNGEKKVNVRAIIDSASQKSYIQQSTAFRLGLKSLGTENLRHSLFGGNSTDVCQHDVYRAHLSNLEDTYRCNFEVLGQEKICESMPPVAHGIWMKELAECGIDLSDHHQGPIEILIGADVAGKLLTGGHRILPSGLVAIETKLGWTVMGRTGLNNSKKTTDLIVTSMLAKDIQVTNLWDLDVLGIKDPAEKQTRKDQEESAKEYFLKTLQRKPDGRYEVSLPWLEGHQPLMNNRIVAERRLKYTIKSLQAKNILKKYEDVLNEWLMEGVIEPVEISKIEDPTCFYLPHRAVLKDNSTTKIRPVFDASVKQKNSPSLNDCLEKGSNLVELIPSILNRFRWKNFGVTADIKKAFLQISINEKDRDYLRFLWFENGDPAKLNIYRHNRVVFGINASPFLLGATISHHLEQVPSHLQAVAQKLSKSMYVDNCVTSLDTKEEMKTFIEQSKEIMQSAQFDLRGWKFNEEVLTHCHNLDIRNSDNCDMKCTEIVSVLGLEWNISTDTLCCTYTEDNVIFENIVTKRSILSSANKLFDPLGILTPITLTPKLLMQDCWRLKLSWDTELPNEITEKFLKWKNDVKKITELQIPRRLILSQDNERSLSFHIFCDASQRAYATCVYLRCEDARGVTCQLVEARSRVAPLKPVTISRLELLACTIGIRLMRTIKEALQLENIPTFYWTDSMNALHWVRNDEQWGVFVMNRVKEIRDHSTPNEWNHVPGALNPADLPSRGCTVKTLIAKKWHDGPLWLKQEKIFWPSTTEMCPDYEVINAEKKKTVISAMNASIEELSFFNQTSSFEKIVRITAWIRRFFNNCKFSKIKRNATNLEVSELKEAELNVWKIVQKSCFKSVKDERLRHLKPFIDSSGLIKVKSRILMRDDYEDFRMPIILPPEHHLVKKLIVEKHKQLLHSGVQTLMAALRENFWILKSRKTIRNVVRNCVTCKRFESKHLDIESPPLPKDRIDDSAVFKVVGIDLAGPLFLKNGSKSWIALFTCAVYRAIHLELVTSLSTDNFLLAFRRFIARRGRPQIVYSDNGTNFVGSNHLLKKIDWKKVINDHSVKRIDWKFIPPASPWWGGFWERLIGLMKRILRKVLGNASLNYEEIITILCDCENIVNSRPITYISEELELEPLTPGMFLRDIKEGHVPDLDRIDAKYIRKGHEYRVKVREDLRKRFRLEYLGQLKNYTKKSKKCPELSIGDIVLIETSEKRINWPLGKVIKLFPGKDGIIRLVKLRTKFGELLRPIQRLYLLEGSFQADDFQKKSVKQTIPIDELNNTKDKPNSIPEPPKVNRFGRVLREPQRLDL